LIRRVAGLLLVAGALASPAQAAKLPVSRAAFKDPPRDVRPKFRWWWGNFVGVGSSLDPAAIADELKAIADAGFGGAEIGFSPGVWANDLQRAGLKAALTEARKYGLKIDMTLGANWPFQTPNTAAGSGLSEQELMYGRTDLTGPTTFTGAVPPPADDDNDPPRGRVVAVTAARVIQGNQLDPKSLVDLSDRLKGNTVSWDVPQGDWILFAFWQRDAEEGVVDHLRAASARAGVGYVDDNQLGAANAGLLPGAAGSFFEDSLELDAVELLWTQDFQREFRKRRGYDMTKYLPLMFVKGQQQYWVPDHEPAPDFDLPGGEGYRYRHDYYETETDLYVANHLAVIQKWARTHGMRFRSQVAYGNALDVTRSARELARRGGLVDDESLNAGDINPFDLTGRDWHFAFDHYRSIVGGSHQGGSAVIGNELGAVFLHVLMMSLTDYKRAMDKAWAAGVTRPLIHGYQSQVPGDAWPGTDHFLGIVSDSWNHRTFPQWAMLKPLADYWGRGALVLQRGRPRTDVAIYRDGFVTTAATITGEVPETIDAQFGDLPQGLREPLKDAVVGTQAPRPSPFFDTEPLERAGYTLQYLDPAGVRAKAARGRGVLFPRGPGYRALVVDQRWMPASTARALDRASRRGLRVVFVGALPSRAAGGRRPKAGDAAVRRAVQRITGRRTARVVAEQAGVAGALKVLRLRPAVSWPRSLRLYSQRRQVGGRELYYLWNPAGETVRFTGSFAARGRPSRLDLWSGDIEDVAVYRRRGARVRVPVELGPGETTVLAFRPVKAARHVVGADADVVGDEVRRASGGTATVRMSDGARRTVRLAEPPAPIEVTDWSLAVDAVGPEGVTPRLLPALALGDWRTLPGLSDASGTGTYTATLNLPEGYAGDDVGLTVDLGRIEGAAQLYVNERLVSPELSPRAPVDVTGLVHAGGNALEVVLTTTLKNKAVAVLPLAAASRPGLAATPGTQPYGLFGPTRVVPYARARLTG
jgi:hypothetical protein